MNTLLLPNGPDPGVPGRREPGIHGTATLADILRHDSEGDPVRDVHRHHAPSAPSSTPARR